MTVEYIERVAAGTQLGPDEKSRLREHLVVIAEVRGRYLLWFRLQIMSASALGCGLVAGALAALVPGARLPPALGLGMGILTIAGLGALVVTSVYAKNLGEQLADAKAHCLGFLGSL